MSKLDLVENFEDLWQLLEKTTIRRAAEAKSVDLSMIAWAFGNACRGSQEGADRIPSSQDVHRNSRKCVILYIYIYILRRNILCDSGHPDARSFAKKSLWLPDDCWTT